MSWLLFEVVDLWVGKSTKISRYLQMMENLINNITETVPVAWDPVKEVVPVEVLSSDEEGDASADEGDDLGEFVQCQISGR